LSRLTSPMRLGTRSRKEVSCSSRLKEAAPRPGEVPVADSQAATSTRFATAAASNNCHLVFKSPEVARLPYPNCTSRASRCSALAAAGCLRETPRSSDRPAPPASVLPPDQRYCPPLSTFAAYALPIMRAGSTLLSGKLKPLHRHSLAPRSSNVLAAAATCSSSARQDR